MALWYGKAGSGHGSSLPSEAPFAGIGLPGASAGQCPQPVVVEDVLAHALLPSLM